MLASFQWSAHLDTGVRPTKAKAPELQIQTPQSDCLLLIASRNSYLGVTCLELPHGDVRPEESPHQAAVRILQDITGWDAQSWPSRVFAWMPEHPDGSGDVAIVSLSTHITSPLPDIKENMTLVSPWDERATLPCRIQV